jgi:hypothetical protein
MSFAPTQLFKRRVPQLLALEGWYDVDGKYQFKLSCRFRDILRCSEFNGKITHFTSCFRKGDCWSNQPALRCLDPNWAVIYTPDKHGNFMGRAFVRWEESKNGQEQGTSRSGGRLVVDKVYGNRLKIEDITMKINVLVHSSQVDTYL